MTGTYIVLTLCVMVLIVGAVGYYQVRGEGLSQLAVLAWTIQALLVVVVGSFALYGGWLWLTQFIRISIVRP